jgi:hypothetical protein
MHVRAPITHTLDMQVLAARRVQSSVGICRRVPVRLLYTPTHSATVEECTVEGTTRTASAQLCLLPMFG